MNPTLLTEPELSEELKRFRLEKAAVRLAEAHEACLKAISEYSAIGGDQFFAQLRAKNEALLNATARRDAALADVVQYARIKASH